MKGVAVVVAVLIFISGLCSGNPPIKEPVQFEQLCNNLKVTGSGAVEMSTSMVDKRIALEYFNSLAGDGNMEMDSERVLSEAAYKVKRDTGSNNSSSLNLFENSKITYSGETPLTGDKLMRSKSFYGGIGATVKETFSVKEMEADLKSYLGTTSTASSAHIIGQDTKSTFDGSWATETDWHKIFDKNIKSRQAFSGKFEMDKQIKLHEKAVYKSALNCSKTPSTARVREGDVVLYEYKVVNPSDTVISDLRLEDSDQGQISLDKTTLLPDQTACGTKAYTVTEQDILDGPRETTATASGTDNLGESVVSTCKAALVPEAVYYSGNSFTTSIGCPEKDALKATPGCARCEVCPNTFSLDSGMLTVYALDVNMTKSRWPTPGCPYSGWPLADVSTIFQLGLTNSASISGVIPLASVWQSLSLDPGFYLGEQSYMGADGNIISGGLLNWNTPYAGSNPNGGFHCTGDPSYDTFDLKMVLHDLGPDAGFRADTYQSVHKSAESGEPAWKWNQIASQDVPETAIDKNALRPFILVGNTNSSAGGGTISWSKVVVAT